jgi:tetratricopeptide (TPR) repeat protein
VGREGELAELRAGLADVTAGHGHLFLLSGEPGIGKTRLADEFGRFAVAQGVRVAWGRCWEGGGAPAYWPWIQVVRACLTEADAEQRSVILGSEATPQIAQDMAQLLPELHAAHAHTVRHPGLQPSDAEQARFQLFQSVGTLLRNVARIAPLLIVIDDLHDADHPSLLMQRFVARQTKDARILIVGTYRDAEVRRSPQLGKLVGDLIREGRSISLAGLSKKEVGDFIASRTGRAADERLVTDLYRATDGNALYVEGVVRLLESEEKAGNAANHRDGFKIPDGVRESILRQLAALSDEANSLVSIASVIGNEFDSRLLELVSGRSLEQIVEQTDEAMRIGILKGEGAGSATHQFSHALIRDVLYEELSANRRIELHGVIGSAIEEIHKGNLTPHLTELAHHYIRALPHGKVDKAIDYSVRAGKAAYALFAYEEVVHHWEAAAALQKERGVDTKERAKLLEDLGAPALLGLEERGVAYLQQALNLYEGLGQVEATARVHVKMGNSLITMNDPALPGYPLALSHFRSAEALLGESLNSRLRGSLYIGLAAVAWELVQGDQGFEASRRAMEIAVRSGDELLWVRGAVTHANSLYCTGDLAKAFQLLNQAWQKADELNSTSAAAITADQACYCHAFLWNPSECEEWALRELARSRLAHAPSLRQRLFHQLAHAYVFAGKLNETKRLLVETPPCLLAEANLAFYAGDWSQAQSTLLRDLEQQGRRPGRPKQESFAMLWLGRLHHARSEYLGAENRLRQALAIVHRQHLYLEVDIRSELAALYVDSARSNDAQSQLTRCREILGNGEEWCGLAGKVARAEAVVAAAERKYEDAETRFEKSVQIFRRYHVPFEEAEALYYWGRALNAHGDAVRATEKFDAAIEIYHQVGAGQRWIERIEKAAASTPRDNAISSSAEHNQFRRNGAQWNIIYQGKALRMKDSRGIRYLAHLLQYPHQEFHVLDLASANYVGERPAGEAAVVDHTALEKVLDPKARAQYARRLADLREEYRDAERCNDLGRSAKTQQEIEEITSELSASLGLGGRPRGFASNAERARVAVSKRIKAAIGQIRDLNAELGRHLGAAVATGNFCSYRPDPQHPIDWQF